MRTLAAEDANTIEFFEIYNSWELIESLSVLAGCSLMWRKLNEETKKKNQPSHRDAHAEVTFSAFRLENLKEKYSSDLSDSKKSIFFCCSMQTH